MFFDSNQDVPIRNSLTKLTISAQGCFGTTTGYNGVVCHKKTGIWFHLTAYVTYLSEGKPDIRKIRPFLLTRPYNNSIDISLVLE